MVVSDLLKRTKVTGIKKRMSYRIAIGFVAMCISLSCNINGDPHAKNGDTPTSGEISIAIDETFQPLMESEVFTFENLYTTTKLNTRYTNEAGAFQLLLSDSVRLIVASRTLKPEEEAYFKNIKLFPRITKIAIDALALIVNKENGDSVISMEQLSEIFKGKITTWEQLLSGKGKTDIRVVFDNKNSSTARYIKEKLNDNKELPANCYALNSNKEVIDYVQGNKNTIGIIGLNWISDGDDPKSLGFLNQIKVMSISSKSTKASPDEAYAPYQAYIAQKFYPLTRELFVISREARAGLGTGFASFVAGDKGQRIVLKSGLLPATMPVRIIGLSN